METRVRQPAIRWTASRIAILYVLLCASIGSLVAGALAGLGYGVFRFLRGFGC